MPPAARPDGSSSSAARTDSNPPSRDSSRRRRPAANNADDLADDELDDANGYFLGAFTVPTNDAVDPQQIQNIIQEQLQQLGGGSNAQISTRTSPDGGWLRLRKEILLVLANCNMQMRF